ncbi:hypothetical protein BJ085DRAFT_36199 [Dimargaris cristalligena]|uniref:Uncharacterized protein n=1 Tax=Dimargaris cristalligena TaxID=215637 RepID=A0A4V1J476_9FUNG|nr:hypothetical protein BJ085DRAFT_36199 [Dimargaris cristalligena]|eukprot:RKP34589.1 hypothetical protein BJ085DRAFT_36199 [Dimargaris cristalligena]
MSGTQGFHLSYIVLPSTVLLSSAIVDRPNSDNGSIGSINLELIPPYPSTGSEHSSDPIRIAEGPLPEFGMFHLGSSSPPNPTSGDPSNPEHSAGLSPSLSPGRGVPQITDATQSIT